MDIRYLAKAPEHVNKVSGWIYNEFVHDNSLNVENVREYFEKTSIEAFPITFVAIMDNKCVGTISIFENDLKNQKNLKPWLGSLYVDFKYRGLGIGENLINRVKEKIKTLGFEKVYLRTETASEYYRSLKWEFIYSCEDEKGVETEVFAIKV